MALKRYFFGFWLVISCNTNPHNYEDSKVFRYNESEGINTLDPAFSKDMRTVWATNQLFSGLISLDKNLRATPDIAKSWHISKDGKTYTFFLRKDVYFHKHALFGKEQTRTVRAADFTYSFQRLLDPKVASPGRWVLQKVASFQALKEDVFQIRLKQIFPPFLKLLAMKYCSVVPKEAVDFFGADFGRHPIGTGAFKFQFWKEQTKLIFRKNNIYYKKDTTGEKLPYLEAVAITFLPEKQAEFLQFLQGNLDFLNSIDSAYKDELLTSSGDLNPKYADKIQMKKAPFLNTEYLGVCLGAAQNPTKDIRIRKAMNYGFDREKMIRYLRNNIGIPAINGFIPKGLPAFKNRQGYSYQPDKAQELVRDYVRDTGDKNPLIVIGTNPQYLDLCEYIQHALKQIGLQVKINLMPAATLREQKVQSKIPVFRGSWVADYPDAENYLFIFHSQWHSPKGSNYTHYQNPVFDSWYEKAIGIIDSPERIKIYQKMDSLLMEQAPVIPLYYDEAVRFIQKNIEGLEMNPLNILDLKNVRKQKGT